MKLLQYKSKEMFSSDELIHKNKMIFNKMANNEIDKAIILKDGKPKFLVMDFKNYERIMTEYEQLKQDIQNKKANQDIKTKASKKKKSKKEKKKTQDINFEVNLNTNSIKKQKTKTKKPLFKKVEEQKLKVKPQNILAPTFELPIDKPKKQKGIIEKINDNKKLKDDINIIEEIEEVEISQEEEIDAAMKSLDSINLDDDMKKIAQAKVKERILKARKERELRKEEELLQAREEDKAEEELQLKIEAQKKQMKESISDFWTL